MIFFLSKYITFCILQSSSSSIYLLCLHNSIVVCSAVSEDRNFRRSFHAMLNKEYDITIQQSQIGGRYMYQVFISGKRVINVVNRSPKPFNDVKLYTSDPWYPAFTSDLGTISNLKIENHE